MVIVTAAPLEASAIGNLPPATTPLAGTEIAPIFQNEELVQAPVSQFGQSNGNLNYPGHRYISSSLISATGTNQATAFPVTTDQVLIVSSTAGAGIYMPSAIGGGQVLAANNTANNVLVYPFLGGNDSINNQAANTPYTLPAGEEVLFDCYSSTLWIAGVPNIPTTVSYNTNSSTVSTTLSVANITGPFGFFDITLNLTGTLAGGATATLPTVANLVAALINPAVGYNYKLRIINSSSGAFTWTVGTNTGWTLNGTMSIAQNTWRDFYVTLTSLTAATLQTTGTGTYS